MRQAANQFSHALNRQLEDKGLSLAEWMVLRELHDGDLKPSALAERLGLTRGAVSKLARKLASSLMITQELGTGDGRTRMLSLTDDGRAAVRVLATIVDRTDEEFFGHIDAQTRALFMANLRQIVLRHG